MIALIDYGAGNVRSVQKALMAAGGDVRMEQWPEGVAKADAVVLPGVGAFDDCVNAMQRQGLFLAAKDFIETGKPFLGICVGYQALFEKSDEFNSCAAGLGVFAGSVVRFSENGLVYLTYTKPVGNGMGAPTLPRGRLEAGALADEAQTISETA